ncbi:Fic family protein [Candidatus Woesearchaeota archaeon]|jgi:Fic family protein|nr:Fic family protein [Candidatus Woesearchaeota archaeon]MBT6520161.1 Fic family protein [Candidatus Woesearchaeota archaeon]MBT7366766.1 Fic family protein [Candidatus Woesearchaeota archaeon]
MAYIYKKSVGDKAYFYLRISKRIKGKVVVKDVAYLGTDPAKIESVLNSIQQYKSEIRKGYKSIKKFIQSNYYLEKVKSKKIKSNPFIEVNLLGLLEATRLHYLDNILKLDSQSLQDVFKHFLIDFAFNSTSIEGNTITLQQANRLLTEDILPKDKSLREVYDLQNTKTVFFDLMNSNSRLSENLVIKIHDKLLERIDVRKGYRNHDIRIFGSRFDVSPVKFIKTDMGLLFEWFNKHKKKLHPFILAGILHHKLETIHPFADGNGRTGRIVLNYLLMKNKYPPLIVTKKNRKKYLQALSSADKANLNSSDTKHYKKLITFLAEELIKSYWDNFNV